jgi:hypothetical protein
MTSRIQLRSVMRKRMGVGDYRFGASLHREIAQPLRIAFSGFRKLDYFVRHNIIGDVAAISKVKRYHCYLIGKTPDCFRVKPRAI